MIGWGFLLLLAFVLAWLFTETKFTRWLAFVAITLIAGFVAGYFLLFQTPEGRRGDNVPEAGLDRREVENQRNAEVSRFALQVEKIALRKRSLTPGTLVTWDNEGNKLEQPDLYTWTFSGDVQNTSDKHTAQDITFEIRLYSCPDYFTTPIASATFDQLQKNCNPVWDRNLTLYNISLKPGEIKQFSEAFKINNQRDPQNWRYWAKVSRVTAAVE